MLTLDNTYIKYKILPLYWTRWRIHIRSFSPISASGCPTMAKVHVCNVVVQNNPAKFLSKFELEITFEVCDEIDVNGVKISTIRLFRDYSFQISYTVPRGAAGGPRVEDHLCWLSRVRGLRPDAGHRVCGPSAGGATQVCLWGRSAWSGQDSRDRRGRGDGYSADVRLQKSGVHSGWLLRLQWLRRPGDDWEHAWAARLRPPHPKHTCLQPACHQVQNQLG